MFAVSEIAAWFFEPNAATKQVLKESLDNEILPFLLSKLDAWSSKNGGYLANGKVIYFRIPKLSDLKDHF